jgi:glycosyltransferase involved in cell wall biosynthesis
MVQPTFSIVVPLYNKRPFIRRAMDSVLAQSVPDFQLIVVDDGSTDGGADVVEAIDDARLEFVRQPNHGPGPARNAGMEHARHEWIAFLDADDCWFPDHLEELGRIAAQRPDAGLISTRRNAVSATGARVRPQTAPARLRQVDFLSERTQGLIHTSAAAIPRHVFLATGGFGDYPHGQDRELWLRISLAYPIVVSSRVTTAYCCGTGGIMDSRASRRAYDSGVVHSVEDIAADSPTVNFIVQALAENTYPESSERLRGYLNRRLQHEAGKSLQFGHIARARSIMRLLVGPVPLKARLYQMLLYLPAERARALVSILNKTNFRKQRASFQ